MFEQWPRVLSEQGTPKRKHWWSDLKERGEVGQNVEERWPMEQT